MRKYFFGFLVWFLYKLLWLTWRITLIEDDELKRRLKNKEPFVLAHWHGDEIPLIYLLGHYRLATITSTSKDGEMVDVVARLLGGKTSRGSSTRGGVTALKGLIKLARSGHGVSFAVDGPKGPIYKVKPGVFELSKLLRAPIFFSGVACDRSWIFKKSWNKAYLPKPFAKITIHWMGPLTTVNTNQDCHSPELALSLEDALRKASLQVAQKNLRQ